MKLSEASKGAVVKAQVEILVDNSAISPGYRWVRPANEFGPWLRLPDDTEVEVPGPDEPQNQYAVVKIGTSQYVRIHRALNSYPWAPVASEEEGAEMFAWFELEEKAERWGEQITVEHEGVSE